MPTADTTARPRAPEESSAEKRHASRRPGDSFLHSLLGTLVAAAVAALALWPHVKTMFD